MAGLPGIGGPVMAFGSAPSPHSIDASGAVVVTVSSAAPSFKVRDATTVLATGSSLDKMTSCYGIRAKRSSTGGSTTGLTPVSMPVVLGVS